MLDVVEKNKRLYNAMIEKLNSFYWDNGISPNETAAKLEEFAAEVSRLAKFIRDNDPSLDPRSPTLRADRPSEQKCPACDGTGVLHGVFSALKCSTCHGTGISNRSAGG